MEGPHIGKRLILAKLRRNGRFKINDDDDEGVFKYKYNIT